MKINNRSFIGLLFLLLCVIPFPGFTQEGSLKVMTFNIRYNNPDDGVYSWMNRKSMVFEVLDREQPDLAGFQEALKGQVDDLAARMKDYAWSGVGRDDGKEQGEFSVVFYRNDRFDKLDGGTFWLSATPDKPGSRSWNAACNRIVTWVKLKDKKSGEILFFFNTHFDHMSVLAREKSAALLKTRVELIARQQQSIVTGDFNDTRNSEMYRILTHGGDQLTNTADRVSSKGTNPDYSFIDFPFNPKHGEVIDFIFIKNLVRWNPSIQRIIPYNVDGKYPSDHLPVITEFTLVKNKKLRK